MKFLSIRITLLSAGLVFSPAALLAQASDLTPQPTASQPNGVQVPQLPSPATQDSAGAPGLTGQMMQDKMFVRKLAEGSLAEIQFGQLAAQKATSPEVKDFGQRMVTDHTKLNEDLKPVAESFGLMFPKKINKDDQAELEKLSKLSGDEFDKEYLTVMVKDHHKDTKEFREEIVNATDPGLKDALLSGVKVVRQHTMMVDKLATEKGIPIPARPPRPAPAQLSP